MPSTCPLTLSPLLLTPSAVLDSLVGDSSHAHAVAKQRRRNAGADAGGAVRQAHLFTQQQQGQEQKPLQGSSGGRKVASAAAAHDSGRRLAAQQDQVAALRDKVAGLQAMLQRQAKDPVIGPQVGRGEGWLVMAGAHTYAPHALHPALIFAIPALARSAGRLQRRSDSWQQQRACTAVVLLPQSRRGRWPDLPNFSPNSPSALLFCTSHLFVFKSAAEREKLRQQAGRAEGDASPEQRPAAECHEAHLCSGKLRIDGACM